MFKQYQQPFVLFIGILLCALLFFWPALQADFVNWDDNDYIYENPVLLNNDWSQPFSYLQDIFTQQIRSIYTPITILSYALEEGVYGLENPAGWHFDNIFLHAINAFLVFLILRRLNLSLNASLLTTLLFVMHPMRVESVAWMTARKDLIFTLFFFLGWYFYLKKGGQKNKKLGYAVAVWLFFLLSLFSKVLAVSFPLVLVLTDIYLDQKIDMKKLLQKIPYFLLAFVFGVVSIYLANSFETIKVESPEFSFVDRIALASSALWTYLLKLFYPYEMVPLYPYPAKISAPMYALAILPLSVGVLWFWSLWKKKYLLFFGLGFFLVNIVFSLQLIPVGQGFKADRYPYIAYIGLFLLVAVSITSLLKKLSLNKTLEIAIPALLLVLLYGPMTYQQTKVWQNSESLWMHQLKSTPNDPTPYKNLANFYRTRNLSDTEFQYLQKAIQLDDKDAGTAYRMGILISEQAKFGTTEDAISWLDKSIASDSSFSGAYINRAVLQGQLGRIQPALQDLQKAEKVDASNADIYLNRAVLQNTMGATQAAINSLDQYLNLRESDAEKWVIKARLHFQLQQYNNALSAVDNGIALNSNNGLYDFTRAQILNALGRINEAKAAVQLSRQKGYTGQEAEAQAILAK